MKLLIPFLLLILGGFYFFTRPAPETPSQNAISIEAPKAEREPEKRPVESGKSPEIIAPLPPDSEIVQSNSAIENVYDLLKEGRKEAAVSALKAILKENPNHEQALLELAMLFTRNPKTQAAAVTTLEKVLRLNPENDTAVGELLQLSREGVSARAILEKLSKTSPDSANLNAGLGFLYLEERKYRQAAQLLERSAKDPNYAEASYNSLTRLYTETQNQGKLISTFKEWIGEQNRSIERAKQANQDYREMQNQSLITQVRLASALVEAGKSQEANQILKEVLRTSPNQPDALALIKRL